MSTKTKDRLLMVLMCLTIGYVIALAITTPPASSAESVVPARYHACANEDGPGPCVWDARHQGNGTGRSYFFGVNEHVFYMPHHLAHWLTHN